MTMFWERGYEGTSIQDLVEGMGIGRRSLYDTFGDKHELFMRSINRYADIQSERLNAVADTARTGRDAVRDLLSVVLRPEAHMRGCLLVNVATELAARDSEAAQRVDRYMDISREIMLAMVRRGQQDGSIGAPQRPEVLASMLLNAWLGLRVAVRSGADRKRLRKDIDEIMTVLDR
nr:TetR/AcrR family transcriptional regulator [Kibdelosporangium phytohabitans]